MNITISIILLIMFVTIVILYYKINLGGLKTKEFLYLTLLFFISLLSITLLATVIDSRNTLQKELDGKLPKLEKIENVYKIVN